MLPAASFFVAFAIPPRSPLAVFLPTVLWQPLLGSLFRWLWRRTAATGLDGHRPGPGRRWIENSGSEMGPTGWILTNRQGSVSRSSFTRSSYQFSQTYGSDKYMLLANKIGSPCSGDGPTCVHRASAGTAERPQLVYNSQAFPSGYCNCCWLPLVRSVTLRGCRTCSVRESSVASTGCNRVRPVHVGLA